MECIRLQVKVVDFSDNQITVRDGKGNKDRVTMRRNPVLLGHLLSRLIEIVRGIRRVRDIARSTLEAVDSYHRCLHIRFPWYSLPVPTQPRMRGGP